LYFDVHDVRVRTKFASELDALSDELALMSQAAFEAVDHATDALLRADLAIASEVVTCDEQLKTRHASCQQRSLLLLALQAPVARDLRYVVAGSQIADDLSQMGSLTNQVARCVYRHHPEQVVPSEVAEPIGQMGRHCMLLTDGAAKTITARDPQPDLGDAVDEEHRRLMAILTDDTWAYGTAAAVELALVGDCYVRYAKHAARIGSLIRFFDTGTPPDPR
jgi:phosphate transport system protein